MFVCSSLFSFESGDLFKSSGSRLTSRQTGKERQTVSAALADEIVDADAFTHNEVMSLVVWCLCRCAMTSLCYFVSLPCCTDMYIY